MTENNHQQLGKTPWKIADELRGAMNVTGLIKPSDPKNSSKKFASYVPFWA